MLDLPRVVDAEPVGELDLVERLVDQAVLVVALPGTRQLVLVEDAELHGRTVAVGVRRVKGRPRHREGAGRTSRRLPGVDDAQLPSVGTHELARDREAEPGAVLLGGEERREDRLALGRGHARPVVADRDLHAAVAVRGARRRPRRRGGDASMALRSTFTSACLSLSLSSVSREVRGARPARNVMPRSAASGRQLSTLPRARAERVRVEVQAQVAAEDEQIA